MYSRDPITRSGSKCNIKLNVIRARDKGRVRVRINFVRVRSLGLVKLGGYITELDR
jgi:hypothetical protein